MTYFRLEVKYKQLIAYTFSLLMIEVQVSQLCKHDDLFIILKNILGRYRIVYILDYLQLLLYILSHKFGMKIGTVITYILLVFSSLSIQLPEPHHQVQDIHDQILSILAQSHKNQQNCQSLDHQNTQLQEIDTIYFNGTVFTMNDKEETVEAVALKNGVIVQVGSNTHVLSRSHLNHNKIKLINLNGRTMLPGFYDAHSHLTMYSLFKGSRLSVGQAKSISQIKDKIKKYIEQNNIPEGQVICCSFYSQLGLDEKRHVTRVQLDQISLNHPIILDHITSHIGVANSKAIEMAGISQTTPDPPGGTIERFLDGPYKGTLSGMFKEMAKVQYIDKIVKKLELNEQSENYIKRGVRDYIQSGVTTAQEGYMGESATQLLLSMKDKVKIDVRGYAPCMGTFSKMYDKYAQQQTDRFRLQGIKLFIDGSIQGYTGFLSQPYYIQPDGSPSKQRNLQTVDGRQQLFRGSPMFSQDQINEFLLTAMLRDIDVIAHCNGDAAIDMFIEAFKNAKQQYSLSKSRVTIIHAQTIRDDQLDQVKQLGLIPSFFVGHTYLWGDDHRDKFLGPQRASRISPARSAMLRNIEFTLHNDSPVSPMKDGILVTIWSAVNRLTKTGKVLGEQQRIDVMQALKGVTIRSAYQGHEQHIKGSIEKGKIADLIILSENPLKVDPINLKDIKVMQTIKNGVSIFKRDD